MSQGKSEATERLLDELRALALPAGKFAIFGSGPMAVRGLRDMHDVDVIVTPELFAELAKRHPVEDHEHGLHRIQIGHVEILDGWYPDVGLIADAETIDGLPFVKLEKVLEWKVKYDRPKDGPDIEVIRRYLAAQAAHRPVAQAFSLEEYLPYLPILTEAMTSGTTNQTLYISACECDITASWIRRLYDMGVTLRIDRVVVLRLRDDVIADMEQRRQLESGFGKRLHGNLAALQDLLARRGVQFVVRAAERIPPFHGYLYGDHFFRGKWSVGDAGYLHCRTTVDHLRRQSSPDEFARAMAEFDAAPEVGKRGVTIGLVIPLKEEWGELIRIFPIVKNEPVVDGVFYYELDSGIANVRLVGTYVGEMGPMPASQRAGRLIDRFKPDLIALVGLAGSLDKEVKLGDVVAAAEVNQFLATSKVIADGERFQFKYSGKHFDQEFVLTECHRHFSQARPTHDRWQGEARHKRLELGLVDDPVLAYDKPRDHVGHIASGDTVGAADAFAVELRDIDRKFLALEMEAAGVAAAATYRVRPVWWLVVRGVSDFSDERKSNLDRTHEGAWRRYAMHNAASYLRALFGWSDFMTQLELSAR